MEIWTGVLWNGRPLVAGYEEDHDEDPLIIAGMLEDGRWAVRKLEDYSFPSSSLLQQGRPLLLLGYGPVIDMVTEAVVVNGMDENGISPGFTFLREVWGRTMALGFEVPPAWFDGTGFESLPGIEAVPPPSVDPEGGDLTMPEVEPGLAWAQEATFYYDAVSITEDQAVIAGSGGKLFVLRKGTSTVRTIQTMDDERHLTAVASIADDTLLVLCANPQTEAFLLSIRTGAETPILRRAGISSFGRPVSHLGKLYIPNMAPVAAGGAMSASLLTFEDDELVPVADFSSPCAGCLSDGRTLWALFSDGVARLEDETWTSFASPQVAQ